HGMTTIFHDDDLVVVLLHVRQCFGEDAGDIERRYGHGERFRLSPALCSCRVAPAIGAFAHIVSAERALACTPRWPRPRGGARRGSGVCPRQGLPSERAGGRWKRALKHRRPTTRRLPPST